MAFNSIFSSSFAADALGHQPYISPYSYSATLPACAEPVYSGLASGEDADSEDDESGFGRSVNAHVAKRDDDAYLGARYR